MCMLSHFGNVIKCNYVHAKLLQSCLLFATLWTIAHQDPLSMGFSRQAYGTPRINQATQPLFSTEFSY